MISPQEQFNRAKAALASGKPDVARTIFRQLITAHPKSAESHFHLARIELQNGKAKVAKKHLTTALKLRPKEPGIWLALMDTEIALKDKKGMGKVLQSARTAKLAPTVLKQLQNKAVTGNKKGVAKLVGVSEADFQKARAAYMAGKFQESEKLASQLIKKSPKSAPLHTIRAASFAQMGNTELAKYSYEKAISLDPEYFEARLQLGQLMLGTGRYDEAGEHLGKALEMASDSPFAHMSLGILHSSMNNSEKAIQHLVTARKSLPKEPRLLLHLAKSYQATARTEEAHQALTAARKLPMGTPEQAILVTTLADLEQNDEAKRILDELVKAHPDSVDILSLDANFSMLAGEFDRMRAAIVKLVDMGVKSGNLLLAYTRAGKVTKDDPILEAMKSAHENKNEEEDSRSQLGFALAKVHDDWGDYAQSFKYLREANDQERKRFPPNEKLAKGKMGTIKRMFEGVDDLLTKGEYPSTADTLFPGSIQITGMPRSGTTLVEQIVSSHSRVTAAGEVGIVAQEITSVIDPIDIEGKNLTKRDLNQIGTGITQAYHRLFPDAEIVTDKAIMSCEYSGIFAAALPSGRMVVLRRDPRDNCLSIYKNRFQSGAHSYSTDLEALARQYLLFVDMQAYWKNVAPDSFYEIKYEDLIENPEEETRRLIDYCGLEWEDSCLEFYKNTRRVKTLSAFQVRQKLYSSSVGAWKNYEEELQPLIKILDKGGALEGY